jgi:RNA polymerase sigma factor (sigma-70 family)
MSTRLKRVVQRIREVTEAVPDADLLQRFARHRDEAAFATLVRRHGEMVLGVCRRVLKNGSDAEDCFQATFLVLARKAGSLRRPESLANWLYGVAYRVARKARVAAARRRAKEANAPPRPEPTEDAEVLAVLDEELSRLPDAYRAAVILCDLQGKTRREVAQELRCAEGTVASRLARGRALLAERLTRRGVTLSAGLCLTTPVSASLVASTVSLAVGRTTSGPVVALTEGIMRAMLLNKLKVVAVLLAAAVLSSAGLLLSASPSVPQEKAGAKGSVVTAAAHDVATTYHNNEARADEQFTGRRLRLTGYVDRVTRSEKSYLLVLQTQVPLQMGVPVSLVFGLDARKQLASLEPGQQVTAEGRCDGRVRLEGKDTVLVRDCTLLKVGKVR